MSPELNGTTVQVSARSLETSRHADRAAYYADMGGRIVLEERNAFVCSVIENNGDWKPECKANSGLTACWVCVWPWIGTTLSLFTR